MLKWLILLGAAGGAAYALTHGKSAALAKLDEMGVVKAEPNWQTCAGGTAYYYSDTYASDAMRTAIANANCTMHPANSGMVCCKG